MILEPRMLNNITHPLIASAYLKKELSDNGDNTLHDVLVVTTKSSSPHVIHAVLEDLDLIKDEVESKVGPFDRLDIRCAH